jgi:hypothetical protein
MSVLENRPTAIIRISNYEVERAVVSTGEN